MNSMTVMLITQGVHGLAYGMLLFLVASGFTLIFGMMGILNMAHASFFMLAAYIGFQVIQWGGNFWLALLLAPMATMAVGMAMERIMLRRVRQFKLGKAVVLFELMLTVGVMVCIEEAVKNLWGTDPEIVQVPSILGGFLTCQGMQYPVYRVFIIALSCTILLLLGLILFKTQLGNIVRAAVQDAEMAGALGINVPLIFSFVFGLGTWLAGVAGVAAAPLLTVFPGLANQMMLDSFIVVALGGFGSLLGAFAVSMILGELTAFGVQFFPGYSSMILFGFMALVLTFKPQGLFGERE
ncbi:MAG: branched-chain amino acid ABC transporter permease [Thermodesulfobacteriota bacterium]